MPPYATMPRWVSRHSDFQQMYVQARRMQADYFFDEAHDVALAATPGSVCVSRLRFDIIRWQAARLVPHKYCETLLIEAVRTEQKREDELTEVVIVKFTEVRTASPWSCRPAAKRRSGRGKRPMGGLRGAAGPEPSHSSWINLSG